MYIWYIKHGYLIFSWLLQDVNYDESANFKPQRNMHTTWTLFNMALRIFFFLSRRTDYKHNYLVQCQIRSQILVIRLCDYRHLKNKVCRSVKHTCWWGHYLGVRYNLNHQKFLSVCSRFVTFQNSFFFLLILFVFHSSVSAEHFINESAKRAWSFLFWPSDLYNGRFWNMLPRMTHVFWSITSLPVNANLNTWLLAH